MDLQDMLVGGGSLREDSQEHQDKSVPLFYRQHLED